MAGELRFALGELHTLLLQDLHSEQVTGTRHELFSFWPRYLCKGAVSLSTADPPASRAFGCDGEGAHGTPQRLKATALVTGGGSGSPLHFLGENQGSTGQGQVPGGADVAKHLPALRGGSGSAVAPGRLLQGVSDLLEEAASLLEQSLVLGAELRDQRLPLRERTTSPYAASLFPGPRKPWSALPKGSPPSSLPAGTRCPRDHTPKKRPLSPSPAALFLRREMMVLGVVKGIPGHGFPQGPTRARNLLLAK